MNLENTASNVISLFDVNINGIPIIKFNIKSKNSINICFSFYLQKCTLKTHTGYFLTIVFYMKKS